ncbi:hypothetical protein V3664_10890 [Streptomyces sp. CS62]
MPVEGAEQVARAGGRALAGGSAQQPGGHRQAVAQQVVPEGLGLAGAERRDEVQAHAEPERVRPAAVGAVAGGLGRGVQQGARRVAVPAAVPGRRDAAVDRHPADRDAAHRRPEPGQDPVQELVVGVELAVVEQDDLVVPGHQRHQLPQRAREVVGAAVGGDDPAQRHPVPGEVEVDGAAAVPLVQEQSDGGEPLQHLLQAQARRLVLAQAWVVHAEALVVPGPQPQHPLARRVDPAAVLDGVAVGPQDGGVLRPVLGPVGHVEVADLLLGELAVVGLAAGAVEVLPEADRLLGDVVRGVAVAVGHRGERRGGPGTSRRSTAGP